MAIYYYCDNIDIISFLKYHNYYYIPPSFLLPHAQKEHGQHSRRGQALLSGVHRRRESAHHGAARGRRHPAVQDKHSADAAHVRVQQPDLWAHAECMVARAHARREQRW